MLNNPRFFSMVAGCLLIILLVSCINPVVTQTPISPDSTSTPQPTNPPTAAPTQVPTAAPAITETPTATSEPPTSEPAPTDTETVPPPVDTAAPTPTLGPAIQHLAAGTKINIFSIRMLDLHKGWAIGGAGQVGDHVFRTVDGGATWMDLTPPQPAAAPDTRLRATAGFLDDTNAWVIYGPDAPQAPTQPSLIWYTHDAGASWNYSVLDISNITYEFFMPSNLVFIDQQHGWLMAHIGAGMNHDYVAIASTTDAGLTWQVVMAPYGFDYNLACAKNDLAFADANTGWLAVDCNGVEQQAYLYLTSDGGSSWKELQIPAPPGTTDFYQNEACGMYYPTLLSATTAAFAMRCRDTATYKIDQDYLYRTDDSGATWQVSAFPSGYTISDGGGGLYFSGPQTILALGRKIYKSSDGGKTWSPIKQVNWDGQFSFLDPNTAWIAAVDSNQYALVKTSDGCKTLVELNPVVSK